MAEITITKENFQTEVLEAELPVLVDFWATWCGPCQMVAPVLAQIAEDYAGQIKVGKVNVDEEMELAQQFRVASIPTMLLFKGGNVEKQVVGFQTKEQLEAFLK